MALTLLSYPLVSQTARDTGMLGGSDERSHVPMAETRLSPGAIDSLIPPVSGKMSPL